VGNGRYSSTVWRWVGNFTPRLLQSRGKNISFPLDKRRQRALFNVVNYKDRSMDMEKWWNDIDRGKWKQQEISLSLCHLFHHKTHRDWHSDGPGISSTRRDTNFMGSLKKTCNTFLLQCSVVTLLRYLVIFSVRAPIILVFLSLSTGI
jgi:hypothetical protein